MDGADYSNHKFLILYTGVEKNRLNILHKIFSRLLNLYIIHVDVLILTDDGVVDVYTIFPAGKNECRSSRPKLLASFAGINASLQFPIKTSMYPPKLRNLWGCNLTVATLDVPPFIYITRNSTTGEPIGLHGIEGLLLNTLAEKMNFRIRILQTQQTVHGNVQEDGSATGFLKFVSYILRR